MTLRPAIVQDAVTGRVLMLAWMNDEAERLTRETGEGWFWSRSRGRLWRKGETSGNTLAVEELRDDCDGDALLLRVTPRGPDLSHRVGVVLRARALADDHRARGAAAAPARTRPSCSTPASAPSRARSERRRSSSRSRHSTRATSASSRRLPTSSITCTCCSRPAASISPRSRTSFARGADSDPAGADVAAGELRHRRDPDDVTGLRCVHELVVADVDPDVAEPVEEHEVARLQLIAGNGATRSCTGPPRSAAAARRAARRRT